MRMEEWVTGCMCRGGHNLKRKKFTRWLLRLSRYQKDHFRIE